MYAHRLREAAAAGLPEPDMSAGGGALPPLLITVVLDCHTRLAFLFLLSNSVFAIAKRAVAWPSLCLGPD